MLIQVVDDIGAPIPWVNVYETGAGGAYLGPYAWGAVAGSDGRVFVPEGLEYVTFSFAGNAVTYAGDALPATVVIGANTLNEITIYPQEEPPADMAPLIVGLAIVMAIYFIIEYNGI